jgi:hypothetical protein
MQEAPGNTGRPPREKAEATKPLQFMVANPVFEDFNIEAVKQGGGKGAKTALFLKMWERYKTGS